MQSCGCVHHTEFFEAWHGARQATSTYFGELTGIGGYPAVERLSAVMSVYGRDVRVLDLDGLERTKRAAGRLKDLSDIAEIQEIRRLRAGHKRKT